MPTVPTNERCAELGCMNPKSRFNRFCMRHGGVDRIKFNQKYNRERREYNAMYSTPHWKTFRRVQLSTHPLCAGCGSRGIVAPARVVDHVFAWAHIGEHAFYRNLFQSLCDACHSEKSWLERDGIYRRFGATSVDYRLSDYGSAVASLAET